MKKIFFAILIFATVLATGCGGGDNQKASFTERNLYASDERSCFCVVDKADIEKMLDAAHRKDAAYLDAMLADGRAFTVK